MIVTGVSLEAGQSNRFDAPNRGVVTLPKATARAITILRFTVHVRFRHGSGRNWRLKDEQRILELKRNVGKGDQKLRRLLRLLTAADTEDPAVEAEYRHVLAEKRTLPAEPGRLEML